MRHRPEVDYELKVGVEATRRPHESANSESEVEVVVDVPVTVAATCPAPASSGAS